MYGTYFDLFTYFFLNTGDSDALTTSLFVVAGFTFVDILMFGFALRFGGSIAF